MMYRLEKYEHAAKAARKSLGLVGFVFACCAVASQAAFAMGAQAGGTANAVPVLDARNLTLVVRTIRKTMSDGQVLPFWVFCERGGGKGACTLPSPTLELGAGELANIDLDMHMAPQEDPPYHGHTIHPHGLDVGQSEDGVPETGAPVLGDNYSFTVNSRYVGSHMYHCHVHTVKHLEMGMYGGFIVKQVDADGNRLNIINEGGPAYDFEWNWVLSGVDPAYHTNAAVGDSEVFADYNPRYFLINGNEGLTRSAPAQTLTAAPGASVVIRLIGAHSVNSDFSVVDDSGEPKPFVLHNVDGAKLPSPQTLTSLEISPGQTKDVMIGLPDASGTWYPQISYSDLRTRKSYANGTVYSRLDF